MTVPQNITPKDFINTKCSCFVIAHWKYVYDEASAYNKDITG